MAWSCATTESSYVAGRAARGAPIVTAVVWVHPARIRAARAYFGFTPLGHGEDRVVAKFVKTAEKCGDGRPSGGALHSRTGVGCLGENTIAGFLEKRLAPSDQG